MCCDKLYPVLTLECQQFSIVLVLVFSFYQKQKKNNKKQKQIKKKPTKAL